MSRIGKQIITLPEKVEYQVSGDTVTIKGPLGSVTRQFNNSIEITLSGKELTLKPVHETIELNALWGTYASHLINMIEGVTKGFTKKLLIEGVGYRAAVSGTKMTLNLGFSHPVEVPVPAGIKVVVDKGMVTITGVDKDAVSQFASYLRSLKEPEPYKGKGIRYDNEVVRRKAGKKVTTA